MITNFCLTKCHTFNKNMPKFPAWSSATLYPKNIKIPKPPRCDLFCTDPCYHKCDVIGPRENDNYHVKIAKKQDIVPFSINILRFFSQEI